MTDDAATGTTDPWTYLFALAPALVVVAVGPGLTLLPAPVDVDLGPVGLVGAVPLVAGLSLAGWALHAFARAGVTPSPAGTPDRLVTDGPFAHTRNPVYLGTVVAVAGEAILLRSVVVAGYAGALWVVYHLLVVYHEEPALRERAGESYETYRDRVPRWV